MKIITEVGIEGVADFTKSVLPIAPGVTYLYGYNALDNGNPNAAGKSLLASAASEIFYDTPMVGVKQDRSKTGTRYIKWRENKKVYSVRSTFEGKTEKIRYRIDGAVAEGRTTNATRNMVREAWGISEDDYRTYGYLDSANPHPLVRGNTAMRKDFFTSFFQLDRLDEERKAIAKRALDLKKIRAQHTELDKTFQEVKADMLTKAERAELEAQVAQLKIKAKKLRAIADKAQLAKSIEDFRSWAKPHLKAFRALVPDLDAYDTVLKAKAKELRLAQEAEEQAADYEVYVKQLRDYKKRTADLDMSKSLDELKDAATSFAKAEARLQHLKENYSAEIPKPEKVEKPSTDKEKLTAKLYKLTHEQEHAQKFKKGVCGECGQPVKLRDPEEIEAEITKVQKALKEWKRYSDFKANYAEWEAADAKAQADKAAIKKVRAQIEALKSDAQLYEKRRAITKPQKVEKPEAYGDVRALERDLQVLKFFASHLDMLKRLDEPVEVAPFDLDKLDKYQNLIAKAEARLEVHNTVKRRAAKIRDRLIELEEQLKDEEAVTTLLEAYGPKAAKKMAVDEISRRLMATVNKYASIAFSDYAFEFVWDTQVQLLVHRPKGTTDVRKLSGAESKLFTLILVISQLMFRPRSQRLSLLILDEPSASFSGETLAKFHALLPHIQQLIPSILIVTPKSDERYPGAAEYTVYRDANGAQLKKGHPSEI